MHLLPLRKIPYGSELKWNLFQLFFVSDILLNLKVKPIIAECSLKQNSFQEKFHISFVTYHCKIYSSVFKFTIEYVTNSFQIDTCVSHGSLHFLLPPEVTVIIPQRECFGFFIRQPINGQSVLTAPAQLSLYQLLNEVKIR